MATHSGERLNRSSSSYVTNPVRAAVGSGHGSGVGPEGDGTAAAKQLKSPDIIGRMRKFEAEKRDRERVWFAYIMRCSFLLLAVGFGIMIVGSIVMNDVLTGRKYDDGVDLGYFVGLVMFRIGVMCMVAGTSLFFVCPFRIREFESTIALSYDECQAQNSKTWLVASGLAAALAVLMAFSKGMWPFTQSLALLPAMWGIVAHPLVKWRGGSPGSLEIQTWKICLWGFGASAGKEVVADTDGQGNVEKKIPVGSRKPRPSTLTAAWLILTIGGWGPVHWNEATHGLLTESWPAGVVFAYRTECIIRVVVAVALAAYIGQNRYRAAYPPVATSWSLDDQKAGYVRKEESATFGLFVTVYVFFCTTGVSEVIIGFANFHGLTDLDDDEQRIAKIEDAWFNVLGGVVWLTAPLFLLLAGRKDIYLWLRRTFEHHHGSQEGAFVAEMMDSISMVTSGIFYVKRETPDERYADDRNRYWRRGKVIGVGESENDGKVATVVRVKLPKRIRESEVDQPEWMDTTRSTFSYLDRESLPTEVVEEKIDGALPTTGGGSRGMSASEGLLKQAQINLRCIDWDSLKANKEVLMFSGAIQGNAAEVERSKWWDMGRAVQPGETIDFFMSHSWKDDAQAKWEALDSVAEEFLALEGRKPTFWLDRVGINQNSVGEGLKVLPINVMACDKMLVLCGETYATRLWCVWELFVLNAFSSRDSASDRIVFRDLIPSAHSGLDGLARLEMFSLDKASCYDPNEEDKLRWIIKSRGRDFFEDRIRSLPDAIRLITKSRPVSRSVVGKLLYKASRGLSWPRSQSLDEGEAKAASTLGVQMMSRPKSRSRQENTNQMDEGEDNADFRGPEEP